MTMEDSTTRASSSSSTTRASSSSSTNAVPTTKRPYSQYGRHRRFRRFRWARRWHRRVDFSKVIRASRTVTTLQVVSNPILDRTFVAPNGTSFPNPIHDKAWASLKALQADLVRFVPWFPYPKKSVAELDAPTKSKTSWDFSHILPQLEDFMDAVYAQNHTAVLNFATQPCWLFGDAENKTQNFPPIDYVSIHHYAGCSKRTDPSTYTAGFFGGFSAWMKDFKDKAITARDASSFPHTKIDLNEIGVIMPHDNVPGMGITANLPDIYWNAAGATYAYVFATLAPLGVEAGVSNIICVGGVE
eukprot:s2746_g8.t1